jgi:transcription elongation factor GreA
VAEWQAGVERFADEMRAIEEEHAGELAARRGSISGDEGVVPAGDALHEPVVRITLWYHGGFDPFGLLPARGDLAESMKDRLIRKFEDEIQALERELKLELPKEIKRARELGDLRENAEYAAAKERQRLVEARISMLKKRVAEIALLNTDRIPHDRAGFGSTLHVVEDTGEKLVFQLVMPEDADAAKGLISTTSPIGRAFLNKEPGDVVTVATPGGKREFEILKLATIHDESE